MCVRRIKTCFKHIILFSITFLFIPQNSYAGQTYKDCFIPRGSYFFAILKGQTVEINHNPFITYTAPETGFYKFFVCDFKAHEKCSDYAVYGNWFPECKGESPPLEVDAWPSNYVWRYIGQFTVSHDFMGTYGCYQNYGWETLAVYLYTKKQDCEVSINISPSEVSPQETGNDNKTTSTIMVTATNPPPEGCTVNFKVEPVENSGGHSHGGNRPKGTVTPTTLTIPAGSLEPVYALYSSSDVSGQEKIIVEVNGSKADEKMVEVKVPDLMPLDSLSWYNLTGSTSSHSANHYGTNSTKVAVYNMASDYWNEALVRLGINDMSLPWGGLFDINGNWSSSPGHSLHRTGESVDIDRCVDGVLVNQRRLNEIAIIYGGERIIEDALRPPPCAGPADTPRIHYEY